MLRLFKHLHRSEWILIGVSVLFIVFQVQLDLRLPDYMSDITALVQTENSEMADILSAGAKMLLCALGSLVSAVFVGFLLRRYLRGFPCISETVFTIR